MGGGQHIPQAAGEALGQVGVGQGVELAVEPVLAGQQIQREDQGDETLHHGTAQRAQQRHRRVEYVAHAGGQVTGSPLEQVRPVHIEGAQPFFQLRLGEVQRIQPVEKAVDGRRHPQQHHAEGVRQLGDDDDDQQRHDHRDAHQRAHDADGPPHPVQAGRRGAQRGQGLDAGHDDVEHVGDGAAEQQRRQQGGEEPHAAQQGVAVFEQQKQGGNGCQIQPGLFVGHGGFLSETKGGPQGLAVTSVLLSYRRNRGLYIPFNTKKSHIL